MADHLEEYLQERPPIIDGDYRDLQRAAFREVIKLSEAAVCPSLSEIESQHETTETWARRQHEQMAQEIRSRFESDKDSARHQNEEHVSRIRTTFETSQSSLDHDRDMKRHTVNSSAEAREDKARAHHDYAVLMADSLGDAAMKRIEEQREEIKAAILIARRGLHSLQWQAEALLQLYRRSISARENGDIPIPEPVADYGKYFCEQRDLARKHLGVLRGLKVCHLFVGLRPFVYAGLIFVLAVLVMLPVSYLGGRFLPPFYFSGPIAGLAALAITMIVGKALWKKSNLQVAAVYEPFRQAIALGLAGLEKHLETTLKDLDKRACETIKSRDEEKAKAKDQFAAATADIAQGREAAVQQIEEEYHDARIRIEQIRTDDLHRVEEERQLRQSQLQQRFEREMAEFQQHCEQEIRELEEKYSAARRRLGLRWEEGWSRIRMLLDHTAALDRSLQVNWDDPFWNEWTPPKTLPRFVRFGSFGLDLNLLADSVHAHVGSPVDRVKPIPIPALLSLSNHCSLFIETRGDGRKQGIETLRATMLRLFTAIPPGRVRFTIIDPVGLGENFAGFMHAVDHEEALIGGRIWTESMHIEQRLTDLTDHMENVIQKYLRNEFETLEQYNLQAGELLEPYRFLVIADLPVNFSMEAVKRLNSIITSGARCGVYTLIMYDARQDLPAGMHLEDMVANSVHLVYKNQRFVWQNEVFQQFGLEVDAVPAEERLTALVHTVAAAAKDSSRVEVAFETIAPPDNQYWSADSAKGLTVPIGRTGARRLQRLSLGRDVAQHVLIAGKTGSGKSTLLHVIATNLSLWYAPDQVEFYLIDFKRGVEFKTYVTHHLPHARAVAIESDREFGLSILRRLDAEMSRRGELFRKAGVENIASYRQATGITVPRTVLIVDEFQIFFSEDDRLAQDAAIMLEQLVRQGRAFGIHVLLGSQTLGGMSGLSRTTMGQMAVRVALQCSEADSQLILDDSNVAARLLSRPGEAIYNDAGGLATGNSPFQTAWLPDSTRDTYLCRLHELVRARSVHTEPMIVFEGNVPADIRENNQLKACIETGGQATDGVPRVWLGEPVTIKDPTAVTFPRQSGANLLVISQREVPALSIMAAALISLAVQHEVHPARFVIFDGTQGDSAQTGTLQKITDAFHLDSRLVEWRAVPEMITAIADEVQRRRESDSPAPRTIYVIVHGLQRYRMLRQSEDDFGLSMGREDSSTQPNRQFVEILREGPPVGVHVLTWADTLASVERTLSRQTLREFDNRVLFQMGASDSSNLVDSPIANQLGFHRAILYSEEQGTLEKFRPYALFDAEWLGQVASAVTKGK
jgi:DNA segregation ATPase FtsK/SpoIIIE, S-DNA-T family